MFEKFWGPALHMERICREQTREMVRTQLCRQFVEINPEQFEAFETGTQPISEELLQQWCGVLGCSVTRIYKWGQALQQAEEENMSEQEALRELAREFNYLFWKDAQE